MSGPMQSLSQAARRWWAGASGDKPVAPEIPQVIVHDPAALKPHDLDDPFFDSNVQTRIGDAIASAGRTHKP